MILPDKIMRSMKSAGAEGERGRESCESMDFLAFLMYTNQNENAAAKAGKEALRRWKMESNEYVSDRF